MTIEARYQKDVLFRKRNHRFNILFDAICFFTLFSFALILTFIYKIIKETPPLYLQFNIYFTLITYNFEIIPTI